MSKSEASDPDVSQEAKPKAWDADSDISSLTPPPSDEEAYFLFQGTALTPKTDARISRRLRQVRRSIRSYNENVLSGSTRKPRRKNMASDVRTETLVAVGDLEKPLVEDPLLNIECTSGALPGANAETHAENKYDTGRRRSTRLRVVDRATRLAEKTKGILGKRRRDTFDAQVENIEVWSERWERNETSKDIREPKFGGPVKKRARLSEELRDPELPSSHGREGKLTRPSTAKRWLLHGLYIGQDQDSGTRCSQKRKKPKEPSDNGPEVQRRRFLPMPMFGGHRMIEMGRDFKLPFDVFSPLPPGQPRPEEWKKTHKNVFVGEAANVWKKAKPLESSRCVCTAESGCDEECFNRFMFYECDNNNCNIGPDRCTNRSFEQLRHRTKAGGKYNIGVDVIKTLDRGHGVRSNRCFEPNQIIVEYTGEIITQNECDNRMNKRYKDSECYYLMDFDQQMILDATRGSIARFVNHSCEPNCKMVKWTVSGKPRMALFAGENGIMTGEELTYDYNFNPYSVKNVQECRCGAPSCRGILGPKPKEIRDALKPITTGGKRKFQQAVEKKVQSMVKKHKPDIPSVKRTFAVAKHRTRKKLANAHILRSSSSRNERLIKKASAQPVQGSEGEKRGYKAQKCMDQVAMITYSRRLPLAERSITKDAYEGTPNRRVSLQSKAFSVKDNVVRSVRRSTRTCLSSGGGEIRLIKGRN